MTEYIELGETGWTEVSPGKLVNEKGDWIDIKQRKLFDKNGALLRDFSEEEE